MAFTTNRTNKEGDNRLGPDHLSRYQYEGDHEEADNNNSNNTSNDNENIKNQQVGQHQPPTHQHQPISNQLAYDNYRSDQNNTSLKEWPSDSRDFPTKAGPNNKQQFLLAENTLDHQDIRSEVSAASVNDRKHRKEQLLQSVVTSENPTTGKRRRKKTRKWRNQINNNSRQVESVATTTKNKHDDNYEHQKQIIYFNNEDSFIQLASNENDNYKLNFNYNKDQDQVNKHKHNRDQSNDSIPSQQPNIHYRLNLINEANNFEANHLSDVHMFPLGRELEQSVILKSSNLSYNHDNYDHEANHYYQQGDIDKRRKNHHRRHQTAGHHLAVTSKATSDATDAIKSTRQTTKPIDQLRANNASQQKQSKAGPLIILERNEAKSKNNHRKINNRKYSSSQESQLTDSSIVVIQRQPTSNNNGSNDLIRISNNNNQNVDVFNKQEYDAQDVGSSEIKIISSGLQYHPDISHHNHKVDRLFDDEDDEDDDELDEFKGEPRPLPENNILFVDTCNYKHSPFGLRHHLSLPGAPASPLGSNRGSALPNHLTLFKHHHHDEEGKLHHHHQHLNGRHKHALDRHNCYACKLEQQSAITSSGTSNESMNSTAYLMKKTTSQQSKFTNQNQPINQNNHKQRSSTMFNNNKADNGGDLDGSNGSSSSSSFFKTADHSSQIGGDHHHHHHGPLSPPPPPVAPSVVLVKFCSIVYAMFLIILGCILHISELKKKTQNSIDHIYSSLVAVIGMLWLAFLHVDLQRYKRFASRFLLLDSVLDPNRADRGSSSDRMSLNTEVIFKRSAQLQSGACLSPSPNGAANLSRSPNYSGDDPGVGGHHHQRHHSQRSSSPQSSSAGSSSSTASSNKRHHNFHPYQQTSTNFIPAYKFLRGKIGAGFYLKCGMAAFCFGHVVHEGLHFGQQVYFLVNDNGRCQDIPALVAHLITPLYSFYQLFIMFKYSNLVINRYKGFAYFGLMHVIGTSIAFWFRTIIEEAFDDFITKMDYFKHHSAYNDRGHHHHKSSPFYTNATNNIMPNTRLISGNSQNINSNSPFNLSIINGVSNSNGGHNHLANGSQVGSSVGIPTNGSTSGVTSFDNVGDDDPNGGGADPLSLSSSSSGSPNSSYSSGYQQEDRSSSNISQNIIALMSPHLSVIAPQLAATLPESYACSQNSLLTTKSMNALPYLYPFTIEYNLLIAATFLELYFNVGKMSTNAYNNPFRREIKQNYEGKEELEYKSNFVVSADCHAANRGLFCGFFTLMVTLVSMVIFFVSIGKPGHVDLGIKINLIQEASLILLILVVATLGYMQTSRLNRNPCIRDRITTNDTLMLIPLPFFFTHSLLSVKAEYGTVTTPLAEVSIFKWIAMIINLISLIEVLVQTSFIIDGLRRCSQSRYLRFKKPGRELLTFCIILNLTFWIVTTFESKSVEQYHVEIEYYGPLSWMFVSHTTLPVMLFYRYHSSVCLAEIWGRAYKAAKSY